VKNGTKFEIEFGKQDMSDVSKEATGKFRWVKRFMIDYHNGINYGNREVVCVREVGEFSFDEMMQDVRKRIFDDYHSKIYSVVELFNNVKVADLPNMSDEDYDKCTNQVFFKAEWEALNKFPEML